MKIYLLILMMIFSNTIIAQKIVNMVLVDENGVTEDLDKAKFIIAIKKYSDTAFERLEYNFSGPMKKRLTYKDALLQNLNGVYADYFPSGTISTTGNYLNNKKEGSWFVYSEAGKIVEYNYHQGNLVSVIDLDSLKNERKKLKEDTTGQQEAFYKGGEMKYTDYVYKNIKIPDRTGRFVQSGVVIVKFTINETGKIADVQIKKSVEFAFDEEVLRVVASSPKWIPASINGQKVKAYREQPVSISFN
jgi:TonB family protein